MGKYHGDVKARVGAFYTGALYGLVHTGGLTFGQQTVQVRRRRSAEKRLQLVIKLNIKEGLSQF